MKCPYCAASTTKVLDTRDSEDRSVTRRRRRCSKCGARFTTYERAEAAELVVVKKDGRREAFSREKLRSGVTKACAKRPVSAGAIEQLVNEVEAELRRGEGPEVDHQALGGLVMEKLRQLDHVAYIRFASVYRAFADLSSFQEEIQRMVGGARPTAQLEELGGSAPQRPPGPR
ncbi:MAG TPA: transcriptional regulator NrdR [Chloroflexota bacterium]